jgi:hypothetical protein
METVNLTQLTVGEGGIYLLGEAPFSGFAIETFPDGSLQTQMSLTRGQLDGVTRRWHPSRQLESEKSFRDGRPHGRHQEWQADGTLKAESTWNAGACIQASGRDGVAAYRRLTKSDRCITHYGYDFQGRLTSTTTEPETPPSAGIAALLALDESAHEPQQEE